MAAEIVDEVIESMLGFEEEDYEEGQTLKSLGVSSTAAAAVIENIQTKLELELDLDKFNPEMSMTDFKKECVRQAGQ